MNLYVQQSIHIRMIKIGGITNSSVFQIGTSGIIKPAAYLYNTGNFSGPAPSAAADQPYNPNVTVPMQSGAATSSSR
ncbi:spore germination protein GerPB [Heyndrickxia coagulans]|uniref:spore germination protein GerPB n=1 Tax=Heyndrickxia TaxID=2837504 RepID=UPI000E46E4B9|nr:spore germination protein GerPB [Heyndrickxia coagulans]MED4405955.1 spore germination protein GerPB [Heyndrickxia coagulans]MED4940662.1 spore germination protein GerPB [Heyndrickxia coagulans]RGR87211.1 spore gernimation protein [Heyndrickxia coagulans]